MKLSNYTVYKHTTPSNKVYIGITSQNNISRRWQNGFGYKNNKHFFNAIIKYGWENIKHEILYTNLTKEQACDIEIQLINAYQSNKSKFGYNQSNGGEYGRNGVPLSEETKNKLSLAHKGKHLSEKTRHKCKINNLGKHKCSEINRKKLSEKRKGKGNPMYGHTFTKEHKYKLSQANGTKVICIETNIIYVSIHEAEKETNINDWSISQVCKGKRKTAGGYHWQYLGDDNAIF